MHSQKNSEDSGVVFNSLGSRKQLSFGENDVEQGNNIASSELDTARSLIMSMNNNTKETLFETIKRMPRAILFLKLTANYWPDETDKKSMENTFHKFCFIAVRIFLCAAVTVALVGFIVDANSRSGSVSSYFVWITAALDGVSVIPAQYYNQRRLGRFAHTINLAALEECLPVISVYGLLFLFSVIGSVVLLALAGTSSSIEILNLFVLGVGGYCCALYLLFNMWFLLMDLNVSNMLIDQLILLADAKVLTMDKFEMVRSDVNGRAQNSKWASDFFVAPCVASAVTVVVLIVQLTTSPRPERYSALAWCFALAKEVSFVFLAFWYVAKVNGKADLLTEKLSTTVWSPDVIHGSVASGEVLAHEIYVREIGRLSMCLSSVGKPISFTLLFKRVSWENVVLSAIGFGVSITVGTAVRYYI